MPKPSHPTGIDQSWGFADPQDVADAGIQVVSGYFSNDSSKNLSAHDVKAYHAVRSAKCPHGVGVLGNWEAQAGGALLGAAQGKKDATTAVAEYKALFKAVGYAPKSKVSIIFSCDRDITSKDYPKTDAYYKATGAIVHAAGFLNGAYAEYDLGNHLVSKKLIEVFWQTYAWSRGLVSPSADFYQYLNGQTLGGASVDFDQVIHPTKLGVWWPPGHPLNIPEDDMSAADVAAINAHTNEQVVALKKDLFSEFQYRLGRAMHGDDTKGSEFHSSLEAIAKQVGLKGD